AAAAPPGDDRAGDRAAREGQAARAREGIDPGGARDRLLPPCPLAGRRARVPDDRRGAVADRPLRALRARPCARAPREDGRGERSLQARELDEAGLRDLRLAHPAPRRRVRAVMQRVARASVTPGGTVGAGVCVLLGIADGDDETVAERLAGKIARLRIFEND